MDLLPLTFLAVSLSLLMAAAWAIQRLSRNSGWVDVIWSFSVGLCGLAAALIPHTGALLQRQYTVACVIVLWALRLGFHIARRSHASGDDPRYAALMAQWGKQASFQLFLFLQIQALAAFVLVFCVRLAAANPSPSLTLSDLAGLIILGIAVVGEGIADAQLARFAKVHKRGVCMKGLWSWSRHPNYFFEWLSWCGWALLAINFAEPFSLLALSAPVLMYVLLVHVSGIPPLEAHMVSSRGDAFTSYQRSVSPFFLLPPKKSSAL